MFVNGIRKRESVLIGFLTALAAVLLFANLGNHYLWQDEAETALVSRTILSHGLPKGYDGKNFFSQIGPVSYGPDYLWIWHTWLPFYLTALSFKMFGVGTFTARLPFAVFGVATVPVFYWFAKSVCKNAKTAGLAAVLLVLSVSFLLLARQARYYSLIPFFSLLALQGYMMVRAGRRGGSPLLFFSALLLFHCNFLFCATVLVTVVLHAAVFERQRVVRVFVLCALVAGLCMPWLIWVSKMRYSDLFSYRFFNRAFWAFTGEYLCHVHYYMFPLFLPAVPVVQGIVLKLQGGSIRAAFSHNALMWKNLSLLILFAVVTIVSLGIASPCVFFRYMAQLIPVFCLIIAVIVSSAVGRHFKSGTAIIAVILGLFFLGDYLNGKAHPDAVGIRYLNIFDYLEEITHDYDGPIEGLVKYFQEHGRDDSTVAIVYGDLPLKFYTNMKVISGLPEEDLTAVKEADWIVFRRVCVGRYELLRYVSQNVDLRGYEMVRLEYPDIPWENRPSPGYHKFRTARGAAKVVILAKKKQTRSRR